MGVTPAPRLLSPALRTAGQGPGSPGLRYRSGLLTPGGTAPGRCGVRLRLPSDP